MKLKPCPFCGGEAKVHFEKTGIGNTIYTAECCTCRIQTPFGGSKERVADLWNRRATHGTSAEEEAR